MATTSSNKGYFMKKESKTQQTNSSRNVLKTQQTNSSRNALKTFGGLCLICSALLFAYFVLLHCLFNEDEGSNSDDHQETVQERTRLVQQRNSSDQHYLERSSPVRNHEEAQVKEKAAEIDNIELVEDHYDPYGGPGPDDSIMIIQDGKLVEKYSNIGDGICIQNNTKGRN